MVGDAETVADLLPSNGSLWDLASIDVEIDAMQRNVWTGCGTQVRSLAMDVGSR